MMLSDEERKARRRAGDRARYLAHCEEVKARSKVWAKVHPEKRRASAKIYHLAHLEKEKARVKAYRLAHLEKVKATDKAWKLAHREEIEVIDKAWKKAHPEAIRAIQHSYRARRRNLPYTLTAAQWQAICAAYNFKCAYCGRKTRLTIDHVLSLKNGGGTVAHNTVPACKPCNSAKRDRLPPKPVNLAMGI